MDSIARFSEYASKLGCTELYEVVKTLEIVHNDEFFRFEVVRNVIRQDKGFDVRIYSEEGNTWKRVHSAWIDRDTIEGALIQASSYFFGKSEIA